MLKSIKGNRRGALAGKVLYFSVLLLFVLATAGGIAYYVFNPPPSVPDNEVDIISNLVINDAYFCYYDKNNSNEIKITSSDGVFRETIKLTNESSIVKNAKIYGTRNHLFIFRENKNDIHHISIENDSVKRHDVIEVPMIGMGTKGMFSGRYYVRYNTEGNLIQLTNLENGESAIYDTIKSPEFVAADEGGIYYTNGNEVRRIDAATREEYSNTIEGNVKGIVVNGDSVYVLTDNLEYGVVYSLNSENLYVRVGLQIEESGIDDIEYAAGRLFVTNINGTESVVTSVDTNDLSVREVLSISDIGFSNVESSNGYVFGISGGDIYGFDLKAKNKQFKPVVSLGSSVDEFVLLTTK